MDQDLLAQRSSPLGHAMPLPRASIHVSCTRQTPKIYSLVAYSKLQSGPCLRRAILDDDEHLITLIPTLQSACYTLVNAVFVSRLLHCYHFNGFRKTLNDLVNNYPQKQSLCLMLHQANPQRPTCPLDSSVNLNQVRSIRGTAFNALGFNPIMYASTQIATTLTTQPSKMKFL